MEQKKNDSARIVFISLFMFALLLACCIVCCGLTYGLSYWEQVPEYDDTLSDEIPPPANINNDNFIDSYLTEDISVNRDTKEFNIDGLVVQVSNLVDPYSKQTDFPVREGYKLVAVELQYNNTSEERKFHSSYDWAIKSDSGEVYKSWITLEDTNMTSVILDPGQQAGGHLVFEIPQNTGEDYYFAYTRAGVKGFEVKLSN